MTTGLAPVVIVGASVAGVRTAHALRLQGYDGTVVLVGEEPHHPYDKPPLSKEMLDGAGSGEAVPLLAAEELESLGIDLRLGTRIVSLDPVAGRVTTDGGEVLDYSKLVIATGVVPRTLPGAPDGVYTIRRSEDVAALRSELPGARNVVVIGAGFIGAEFASAARAQGGDVVVVEAQATPLEHLLGAEVGAALGRLHETNGVEVLTGVRFAGFWGGDRVTHVDLSDGRRLPADVVVVGIGAEPDTDWLAAAGLPVTNGLDCDESLRVVGFDDVYAAGDIASFPHPRYDGKIRIEHWTNANDHAAIVAAGIVGKPAPQHALPYVWSDQYGRRIQIAGRPSLGTPRLIRGGVEEEFFLAAYADDRDVLVGAVVVDDPRLFMRCRKAVTNWESWHTLVDQESPV